MNIYSATPARRCSARLLPLLAAAALLASCGGGGEGGVSVASASINNASYGRFMTVVVNGSGLENPNLQMTVEGAGCENISRGTNASDSQVSFSCEVTGVGFISARIRGEGGRELARVSSTVPLPQVSLSFRIGATFGTVLLEIDPAAAPVTARNFMTYVNQAFYRDTLIHRVVTGQLIQGGGFSSGPTRKLATQEPIVLESNNGLKNLRGTIAMARTSEPNSAQAEYYINVVDNPAFDRVSEEQPGYAVFGRVVEGLDVVDRIGALQTTFFSNALPEFPVEDVVLTSALQLR